MASEGLVFSTQAEELLLGTFYSDDEMIKWRLKDDRILFFLLFIYFFKFWVKLWKPYEKGWLWYYSVTIFFKSNETFLVWCGLVF